MEDHEIIKLIIKLAIVTLFALGVLEKILFIERHRKEITKLEALKALIVIIPAGFIVAILMYL